MLRDMDNLADMDTSFLVPCKRCTALLQEQERVCPFCGRDQSIADDADDRADDAGTAIGPLRGAFPGREALSLVAANAELGIPPATFWQREVVGFRRSGATHWAGNSVIPGRLVVSVMVALALAALALSFDHLYLDKDSEAVKQREFGVNVERAQSALNRGDLPAAERVLDVLDTDHADSPNVQALREKFDERAQQQAAKHDQLRDAAQKAAKALGLSEPPASPASPARPVPQAPPPPRLPTVSAVPAPAPVPAPVTVVPTPAPQTAAADSKDKECSDALAALALCAKK
jgi:hypothetical protein